MTVSVLVTLRLRSASLTHLEEVRGGSGVQAGLLVDGSEDSRLLRFGGVKGGCQIEFEPLGDEVLELDLSSEEVGGCPCLQGGYQQWVTF